MCKINLHQFIQFAGFLIWIDLLFKFSLNLCIEWLIRSQFTWQFAGFTSFLQQITYFNWKFIHCSEIANIQPFNMQMCDYGAILEGQVFGGFCPTTTVLMDYNIFGITEIFSSTNSLFTIICKILVNCSPHILSTQTHFIFIRIVLT